MKHLYRPLLLSVLLLAGTHAREACAQDDPSVTTTSAAPFLRVSPDARGAGMGDAGAATPGDVNAAYWNPAKLVFVPGGKGVSLSYAPWLRQAAANMWISQLSGFFMPGRNQAVGASLVYFNQGAVSLRDMNRQRTGDFNPREFALTGTYALKLSEYASLAAGLKYVYSNLVGSSATGLDGRPAHALAGDVGAYFQTDPGELHRLNVAFGTTLSNLGTRVNYGTSERYFLPTNLRVGTGVTYRFGEEGRLTFALDANKLMLPSRPVYDFPDLGPPNHRAGPQPRPRLLQQHIRLLRRLPRPAGRRTEGSGRRAAAWNCGPTNTSPCGAATTTNRRGTATGGTSRRESASATTAWAWTPPTWRRSGATTRWPRRYASPSR
jgi:hypothetical protein